MTQSAKHVAVALLARRDHSRQEIRQKLIQKQFDPIEVEQVLDDCQANGYLNDERYGALLLRSHISKGHGKSRIQQALVQKGVDKEAIQHIFEQSDCDWFELAKQKALKKYANKPIDGPKDRAKRIRYLMGQGFSYDEIAYALDYDPYDD